MSKYVLAALGVAYWTGLHTRNSVVETRRIGEEQTKAYLAPTDFALGWESGEQPFFTVTYKNAGQTPAVNVRELFCFVADARPPTWTDGEKDGITRQIIAGGETVPCSITPDRLRFLDSFVTDDRGRSGGHRNTISPKPRSGNTPATASTSS